MESVNPTTPYGPYFGLDSEGAPDDDAWVYSEEWINLHDDAAFPGALAWRATVRPMMDDDDDIDDSGGCGC